MTNQRAVKTLRESGMTMNEIAEALGIAPATLKANFSPELGPLRRGRVRFKPTEMDRKNVQSMAGYGIPHSEIAKLVINPGTEKPICRQTLEDEFRRELDVGATMANARVGEAMFLSATNVGGPQSVTAQIFWAKCRMGWREPQALEVSGPGGGPVQMESAPKDMLRALIAREREAVLVNGNGTGGDGRLEGID